MMAFVARNCAWTRCYRGLSRARVISCWSERVKQVATSHIGRLASLDDNYSSCRRWWSRCVDMRLICPLIWDLSCECEDKSAVERDRRDAFEQFVRLLLLHQLRSLAQRRMSRQIRTFDESCRLAQLFCSRYVRLGRNRLSPVPMRTRLSHFVPKMHCSRHSRRIPRWYGECVGLSCRPKLWMLHSSRPKGRKLRWKL